MKRGKGTNLILLLVLLVLVFSGAVWWMTEQQLAQNKGQKTIKTYTLHESVILGRFEMELTDLKKKTKIVGETNEVDAKGTYYCVNLSMRNLDANPQPINLSQFKVVLADGGFLAADNTASLLANPTGHAFFLRNANGKETVTGTLVFDVPPTNSTVRVQATSADGTQAVNFDLK
ncbi:DUF4352 domain-containing protein [Tumebacillus sp. ITR2]|uniref:DUF4352 domain-containing protein n=1 Tax=Tumebacillus amylolyticus TaxID=2801339 RepID=A0ABS1J7X9_9BACL|nr:DUF4352 domain-containing protein [Tumebacillus amylolyticus]MBL0386387.1 DUF4352 domain-containing protein [Tumebacillus amylolyticus]